MKIDDRIYELISGKLDDHLSPMEEAELSSWLAEDVGHEEVYAEIKKIRDQVKLLHRDFAPDTENVLKRVKRGRGRQIGFRYWWKYGFDPKWYLSPFPQTEINKGYGLIQNPGW